MSEVVTFDSVSLASIRGLSIIATDPHRPSSRLLNASDIARADKSVVASTFYKSRKIHVLATLERNNKADLQTGLRELEGILQGKEKILNFTQASIPTDYTATKSNILLNNTAGGFTELDIEFYCSDPIGYATSSTTLYNYAHLVGGAYSFAVTWSGNVRQQPVITITLNTVTGGTSKTITIGNPTTGISVAIQRTWANSDILIIDRKNKTITVNGSVVDYTGRIPDFTAKEPITYADTFTTRNIAVNIVYQIRNL